MTTFILRSLISARQQYNTEHTAGPGATPSKSAFLPLIVIFSCETQTQRGATLPEQREKGRTTPDPSVVQPLCCRLQQLHTSQLVVHFAFLGDELAVNAPRACARVCVLATGGKQGF